MMKVRQVTNEGSSSQTVQLWLKILSLQADAAHANQKCKGDSVSYLRADRLALLHTLPHPQLDFTPQSS